jgi:hypothetical protein
VAKPAVGLEPPYRWRHHGRPPKVEDPTAGATMGDPPRLKMKRKGGCPNLPGCLMHGQGSNLEVFYGTQYDPTVVRSYYQFFSMGKMVV